MSALGGRRPIVRAVMERADGVRGAAAEQATGRAFATSLGGPATRSMSGIKRGSTASVFIS